MLLPVACSLLGLSVKCLHDLLNPCRNARNAHQGNNPTSPPYRPTTTSSGPIEHADFALHRVVGKGKKKVVWRIRQVKR